MVVKEIQEIRCWFSPRAKLQGLVGRSLVRKRKEIVWNPPTEREGGGGSGAKKFGIRHLLQHIPTNQIKKYKKKIILLNQVNHDNEYSTLLEVWRFPNVLENLSPHNENPCRLCFGGGGGGGGGGRVGNCGKSDSGMVFGSQGGAFPLCDVCVLLSANRCRLLSSFSSPAFSHIVCQIKRKSKEKSYLPKAMSADFVKRKKTAWAEVEAFFIPFPLSSQTLFRGGFEFPSFRWKSLGLVSEKKFCDPIYFPHFDCKPRRPWG